MNILIICLVLFYILYGGFWYLLRGKVYEMDPADHKFMFSVVWAPYRTIYWIIFASSLAGAFTLADLRIPSVGSIFLISSITAFLFNLWVTLCYEGYIAAKYTITGPMRSSYSAGKYALTLALGTISVVLFSVGIVLAYITVARF